MTTKTYVFFIVGSLITVSICLGLWIGICAGISYVIGRAINKLFLSGRQLASSWTYIISKLAGYALVPLCFLCFGCAVVMFFNKEATDWWYRVMLPFAIIGNTVSVICFLILGICKVMLSGE